jgi:hypothetical protein
MNPHPGPFQLQFFWDGAIRLNVPATNVVRRYPEKDAAILLLPPSSVPEHIKPLSLSHPPPSSQVGEYLAWSADGFPAGHAEGMRLTGSLTDFRGRVGKARAMQLLCDQGGQGFLMGASGAAVCCGGIAIGLIRYGTLQQRVIFATALEDLVEEFPELQLLPSWDTPLPPRRRETAAAASARQQLELLLSRTATGNDEEKSRLTKEIERTWQKLQQEQGTPGTLATACEQLDYLQEQEEWTADVELREQINVITIGIARYGFTEADRQVGVVADYKELHDILQKVERQCYNPIRGEAERARTDESAAANLQMYTVDLEPLTDRVQHVADRGSLPRDVVDDVRRDLKEAQRLLWQALAAPGAPAGPGPAAPVPPAPAAPATVALQPETRTLRRATSLLKHLVQGKTPLINAALREAARSLPLPHLTVTLKAVRTARAGLPHAFRRPSFEQDVDAFIGLSQTLPALVEDHSAWQSLEVELNLHERNLNGDIQEFVDLWSELRKATNARCPPSAMDPWAVALRDDLVAMNSAISLDAPGVRRAFWPLRRRVANRFYEVDNLLRAECTRLRDLISRLLGFLERVS